MRRKKSAKEAVAAEPAVMSPAERGRLGGLARSRNYREAKNAFALYAIRRVAKAKLEFNRGVGYFESKRDSSLWNLADRFTSVECAYEDVRSAFQRAWMVLEGLMEDMGLGEEFERAVYAACNPQGGL